MKVGWNATLATAPSPELPGGQGEQSLDTGHGATRYLVTGRKRFIEF
jgi:hypothetical protein